jgi:hypothetical protein
MMGKLTIVIFILHPNLMDELGSSWGRLEAIPKIEQI